MIDWGVITTGIAAIIGGIVTGLATWKTMSSKEQSDIDSEQKEWRAELVRESKDLRERIERMQATIDTLMNERLTLKRQVTELTLNGMRLESEINSLRNNNDLN